jgi:hypothetical protein
MISKAHSVLSYLIILFGLIHIYFVSCLHTFDEYALWFIGSGIAIIFAGFINLIRAKSSEKIVSVLCLLTNFLMTSLFIVAFFAMQKPQVYLGIFIFALALITSLKNNPKEISNDSDNRKTNI